MAAKYWLKLYHEILHDMKMCTLSDRMYRRVIECLLMAGELDEEGFLPSVAEMAFTLRTDEKELLSELKALEKLDILTFVEGEWLVTNFAERQAAVTNAERVRRWRDRRQKDQYEADDSEPVTNRYADTDIDTESDTEPEPELDTEIGGELFDACVEVYEKKKGKLVTDGQAFAIMINNFLANGVTAQDYAYAIDAMDADGRYKGGKPTSYESWALGYAEKRKNPAKYAKDKKIRDESKKLDPETYRNWGKKEAGI